MSIDAARFLVVVATGASGILAGASLDQSIKQLPARHKMGAVEFSRYSQAADLSNGVLWYAILGVGAALLTIAAAVAAWTAKIPICSGGLLSAAAALAVFHSLTTIKAAPINFSQRAAGDDAVALAKIFDRFEYWQLTRCALQTATFIILLIATAKR